MARGFSVIEVVITLATMGVLLCVFVPSYTHLTEKNQIHGLADDLQFFFSQARSEAVFRNQDLWGYYQQTGNDNSDWRLSLHAIASPTSVPLLALSGRTFNHLHVESHFADNRFLVEGINGRINSGSISFGLKSDGIDKLKVITYALTGRIKTCGLEEERYGYPQC